ncbi:hypothetical protein LTR15_005373 [Elasticomyces elasticus]|nr:hypothetical protein LTR15_005373 [Elasticomyces elasticus]
MAPIELTHEPLADGLYFGESPRYHDGKLYISDMTGRTIYTIDPQSGHKEVLVEVEHQPNGMCFAEDGSLIYSSMFNAQLWKYKDGEHTLYADMSDVMTGYCGDMVIDKSGTVYLDDTGARVLHGEQPRPGKLLAIRANGSAEVAAENIIFPNGIFLTGDGKILYVAETFGYGLLKYDVDPNGSLSNRQQVWAVKDYVGEERVGDTRQTMAGIDGGCMDAEGGMWLSLLSLEEWVRLSASGSITHRIKTNGHATACTLGGEDGKTLFLVTNTLPEGEHLFAAMVAKRTKGTVSTARVDVGHGDARP